jgi:uncharacterized protein YodC (DUF2158 family)
MIVRWSNVADDFQVGDTVQLKSGGPIMTIDSLDMERQGSTTRGAWCEWFEKNKPQPKKWYALTSLKKVNPEAESSFYPGSSIMG